jgi:hypothetical protein
MGTRLPTKIFIVLLLANIFSGSVSAGPKPAAAFAAPWVCAHVLEKNVTEDSDMKLHHPAPVEQSVPLAFLPRKIESIFPEGAPPVVKMRLVTSPNRRVIIRDRELLERDFPELKGLSDRKLEEWILSYAEVTEQQANLGIHRGVNSHIPTSENPVAIRMYKPPTYNRATIAVAYDPADPRKTIGLIDIKHNGAVDPMQKSHRNGLGVVAEGGGEFLRENAVRWKLWQMGSDVHTVGVYWEIDYGFDVVFPDGTRMRAGQVARQAHKRDTYSEIGAAGKKTIRSAWLSGEKKAPVVELFQKVGIDTGHENNIQGMELPDGNTLLVDFAHYIFPGERGHGADPAVAVPFRIWGWDIGKVNSNPEQWELSTQDHAYTWMRDTNQAVVDGRTEPSAFAQMFNYMMGPLEKQAVEYRNSHPLTAWESLPTKIRSTIASQWIERNLGVYLTANQRGVLAKGVAKALRSASDAEPVQIIERTLADLKIGDAETRPTTAAAFWNKIDQGKLVDFDESALEKTGLVAVAEDLNRIRPTKELDKVGRDALTKFCLDNNIPMMIRKVGEPPADIPVILVNAASYSKLKSEMDPMIGDIAYLLPDASPNGFGQRTDHGALQIGSWQMDFFHAQTGAKAIGEGQINETGIRWRRIEDVVRVAFEKFTTVPGKARPILLETAYRLSPEERMTAEIYHRMRRSGIIRVQNEFSVGNPLYDGKIAVLDSRTSETCYKFGVGVCGSAQIELMEDYLHQLGVGNPAALLKHEAVRKFIAQAEKQLIAVPLDTTLKNAEDQAKILHDWFLNTPENRAILEPVMPHLNSEIERTRFMNYVFAIEETKRYSELTARLGWYDPKRAYLNFPQRTFVDARRPRATAIFIYDGNPAADQQFRDGTYEALGGRFGLQSDGSSRPANQR